MMGEKSALSDEQQADEKNPDDAVHWASPDIVARERRARESSEDGAVELVRTRAAT